MKVETVLNAAFAAGINIRVSQGNLVLKAPAPPPVAIVDAIFQHKSGIISRLAQMNVANGPLSPDQIEITVNDWLNQHPEISSRDRCAWCHNANEPEHVIVPFSTSQEGHTWLHPECWWPWHERRRMMAMLELQKQNISHPCKERFLD